MLNFYIFLGVIFFSLSSLFAKDVYPSVGYASDNNGRRYCMKTWGKTGRSETSKCFSEDSSNNTLVLSMKINVLAEENQISNSEFLNLVKDATSLRSAYDNLVSTYTIRDTCAKVEEKFNAERESITREHDFAIETLSCSKKSTNPSRETGSVSFQK